MSWRGSILRSRKDVMLEKKSEGAKIVLNNIIFFFLRKREVKRYWIDVGLGPGINQ